MMNEQRETDFIKLDSLYYLADQNGLAIHGFWQDEDGHSYITYLDKSRWIEPASHETSDSSIESCLLTSKSYPRFTDMVLGEIKRLREQL